jgi:hypothetical protein
MLQSSSGRSTVGCAQTPGSADADTSKSTFKGKCLRRPIATDCTKPRIVTSSATLSICRKSRVSTTAFVRSVGDVITFIECKGLIPGSLLPDSEIEAWLTKRIPSVRSQTLENSEFKNLQLTFELWLTGELSPDAQRRIATARAAVDPNRYTIKVVHARDIKESVKKFPDLRKVVKQHFLEHPMAASIDVISPVSKRQISQVETRFSDLAHRDFGSESIGADQSPA